MVPMWGGGGLMPRRNEEFHEVIAVLQHICDVNGVIKVPLAFCCPFWTEVKLMFSCLLPDVTMKTERRRNLSNKSLVLSCGC